VDEAVGAVRTIWARGRWWRHGHILLNGRKTDRPSCEVSIGDVITLKPKLHKLAREAMESMAGHEVPGWLELNPAELAVRIVAAPTQDQIPSM